MKISLRWLNEYLQPGDISAADAEKALTFCGFPIESAVVLPSGDTMLDVEVTSNRGDVLSHIGVARELAASTGRALKLPAPTHTFTWFNEPPASKPAPASEDAGALIAIDNQVPDLCPLFTARIIRGVKVGPSPKWLAAALEGVGQRSINNVVDITNFVAFEYGQPSHVFDLNTIAAAKDNKRRVIIRRARKGEKLTLLDDKTITLIGDELVVADDADGGRPISLAGVMGGASTAVTEKTTDILLEAATWAPVAIRTAARRFALRTDASYRFERIVDARTIDAAANRLATLICALAHGKLCPGIIHAGAPNADKSPLTRVNLRPARVRALLGLDVPTAQIERILKSHEIETGPGGTGVPPVIGATEKPLTCTIPAHRPDLDREIDLIEEVARTIGLDKLPVHEKVAARVAAPQASERAVAALTNALNGLGFYEAVTFTFVSPKHAAPFVPAGLRTLEVCDDRRTADPVLRPSALPSLLLCRRANQDRGVHPDGTSAESAGFRLYELSAVFAEQPPADTNAKGGRGKELETINLALIADACFPSGAKSADQKQSAVRLLRGTVETLARALGGKDTKIDITPASKPPVAAFDPAACAEVTLNGSRIGLMGLISPSVQSQFGLDTPLVAAELNLAALVALFPPKALVQTLPQFPAIERDLSLIVREQTPWADIHKTVDKLAVPLLEDLAFVGTYRGAQTGPGNKSVTLRMTFRDPARTLTRDEVTPQVNSIIAAAKSTLGAEVRTS